jgi:hypothetical protein
MAKTASEKLRSMAMSQVYPLYLAKVARKGGSASDVDAAILWLSGSSMEEFFRGAPSAAERSAGIRGLICGVRIEEIEDEIARYVRCMDKLVDDLAKGRPLEQLLSAKPKE